MKLWTETACRADVAKVLGDLCGDQDVVTPNAELDGDLDLADVGDLINELETTFELDAIDPDAYDQWTTVQHVQDYVWRKVRVRNPPSQIKPTTVS